MTQFKPFSQKQKLILTWWSNPKTKHFDAVICDGAIRSGKTLCMSLAFVFWACCGFNNEKFAICSKTISCVKRNILFDLISNLKSLGFECHFKSSQNYIDICFKNSKNRFFLFGGNNEASCSLIQGLTLAGAFLDEVALMPKSFVEQTLARCSIQNSKFWFNCNPQHPNHWFFKNWIKKAKQKNALYIHFKLNDNPALSKQIKERYKKLYSGAFFKRFIEGKWVAACGQIYSMFSLKKHVVKTLPKNLQNFVVSIDYGIVNPASFGLWGKFENTWFRVKEFYYDSKKTGRHLTDEELYSHLKTLTKNFKIELIIIDPSASSFIECIKRHADFKVVKSQNDVLHGISLVSEALKAQKIMFHESCTNSSREFFEYCWNENKGHDCVKKENDHAMDDIRYFVSTIAKMNQQHHNNFFVMNTARF